MENNEVLETIVNVITPYCKNQDALNHLSDSTRFMADLGINSARLVDIVLAFEDAFDVEIDDETADKIESVGDAVRLITKLKCP